MGVRAIFMIDTPWTEQDLPYLQFEQAADVMILTKLGRQPMQLTRYDHDNWSLDPIEVGTRAYAPTGLTATPAEAQGSSATGYQATPYEYVVTTIDGVSGQESLPTEPVTATTDLTLKGNKVNLAWDVRTGAERYNIYKKGGGAFGYIGTSETNSFTDDFISPDFSQSYPRHRELWSSTLDYPGSVTFWQQRMVFGRSLSKPNAIWGSQAGNFFNFNASLPVVDSDAVNFAVSARRVNAILHLVPLGDLITFTTDTIFSINGADGALTPTSVDVTPEGYRAASALVRPVVVDDVIFYATAKGAGLRTLGYTFEADGYKGNDLTVFSPHLFRDTTLRDMAWAEHPNAVLNVIGEDGDIRCLTWQQEQDVWGWSMHYTQGFVENCCTITENGEDRTYFIVRRQLPGVVGDNFNSIARVIERSASTKWTDVKYANYVDCSTEYHNDAAPVKELGGLYYLEGRQVSVLADGEAYINRHYIQGGKLKLERPASHIIVGLAYDSWVRTLPPTFSENGKTNKGTAITISGFTVKVVKTRGLEAAQGRELPPELEGMLPTKGFQYNDTPQQGFTAFWEARNEALEIKARDTEPMSKPNFLFTGDLSVQLEAGDYKDASVIIQQRYPLPMRVTNIVPDVVQGGSKV